MTASTKKKAENSIPEGKTPEGKTPEGKTMTPDGRLIGDVVMEMKNITILCLLNSIRKFVW